jgi:RNA-splicing ligase RtcB
MDGHGITLNQGGDDALEDQADGALAALPEAGFSETGSAYGSAQSLCRQRNRRLDSGENRLPREGRILTRTRTLETQARMARLNKAAKWLAENRDICQVNVANELRKRFGLDFFQSIEVHAAIARDEAYAAMSSDKGTR